MSLFSEVSANIFFTKSWQSSKFPVTETASTLSLFQVVICFRWTSDIFPSGKNIKECKFSKF